MKNTMIQFLGILMLISTGCEDKAGYHEILSRPTIPNSRGINRADTTLNYNSEFKKEAGTKDNTGNMKTDSDSTSANRH